MNQLIKWISPDTASTIASKVDAIALFVFIVSLIFFIGIFFAVIYISIKYHRKNHETALSQKDHSLWLELTWTIIPSILLFIMFVWGANVYLSMGVPPGDSMTIKVSGQKWFWTFTYPDGTVSTNDLVVPENQPIRILTQSQDVLHSFFVPAFRIKMDALPNRYGVTWFEANKKGSFPYYCTEYCGLEHSSMVGKVTVVSSSEFDAWLDEQSSPDGPSVEYGKKIYTKNACKTCHTVDGSKGTGPTWQNAYGSQRSLSDGSQAVIDENYIRNSILNPGSQIAEGYANNMPSYTGILDETAIDSLIMYIKSLNGESSP